jgi:hypothetical protein
MRNAMSWIRVFIIQFSSVFIVFFGSDFFYTNYLGEQVNEESVYRIQHDIYHHSLLPSFDGIVEWGGVPYRVCTDGNGFKSDCENVATSQTSFDVAFIGDSFTEAIGMPYEDSFVGMFADAYPGANVANLGVISYAPTVYRAKVEDLFKREYRFNHVIVFIDISDIQDESIYYRDSSGYVRQATKTSGGGRPLAGIKNYVATNFSLFTYAYRSIKQVLIGGPREASEDVFTRERSEWTYNQFSNAYGDLGVAGSLEKAVLEMTLLYEFLERNGVSLSVGIFPWPAQISEMSRNNSDTNLQVDIWSDFCTNRCEYFVNMFSTYYNLIENSSVDEVYQTYFIQGDVHYNREGNRLIKQALLELGLFELVEQKPEEIVQ